MILAELPFATAGNFQVVQGNLLEEPVDAIVNAANGHLAHGGGVAGIISRAAVPNNRNGMPICSSSFLRWAAIMSEMAG